MSRRLLFAVFLAACASGRGTATLDTDGAWVRTFPVDREAAYHAAMSVLIAEGYTVVRADPLGGSFVAKSPVRTARVPLFGDVAKYTLARIAVEPAAQVGTRVRLLLVRTQEPVGAGRRPNNDRTVSSRDDYEAVFEQIASELR